MCADLRLPVCFLSAEFYRLLPSQSGGASPYCSYLIAGRDRIAASLDDLKGDTHAFSDPDSNSGWLVTATALARRGLSPDRFFAQTIFTWGHRNVVRAVASGLTGSGSVDGYVYEVMRETEPDLIAQTQVVEMSELLGFPPVACATAVAEEPATKQLQAALRMGGDEDGSGPANAAPRRICGRGGLPVRFHRGRGKHRPGDRWMRVKSLPLAIKVPAVVKHLRYGKGGHQPDPGREQSNGPSRTTTSGHRGPHRRGDGAAHPRG